MKELSIFVDESGDFGEYDAHSPYYIITMILHDQTKNISLAISKLDSELTNLGYENHVVHTEPLIRREEDYKDLSPNERRNILIKLYYFVIKCEIQLSCDYKLFQAADLICTLELLRMKAESGNLTRSEKLIFHSIRDLKKDFLKRIRKKEFKKEPTTN